MQRDVFGVVTLITVYTILQYAKANHRCIVMSVSGVLIKNAVIKSYHNPSIHECFTDCKENPDCRSINFFVKSSVCEHNNQTISDSPGNRIDNDEATYIANPDAKKVEKTTTPTWKLIARFSNSDTKNWMATTGAWWYDITTAQGDTSSTSVNQDMIAPDFWTTKGQEIKITRTDDSTHTPLLVTTSNCLGGKTFREMISSFGNFRNGAVWSSDKCLGKCTVTYGGQYASTAGFSKTSCDSNVLTRNQIGFWCDYSTGAGAVFSIGGAGSACDRADHGLAVTEENAGKFGTGMGCDFGDNGQSACITQSYALNMWIKIETQVEKTTTPTWKLIARFSNSDTKNWMATTGAWWYDITTAQGDTSNTAVNQDMIAPDFWTAKGQEIKVTRTDDSTHTPLLVTTSNCLGGKTFREMISSFGNFRNGAIWSSDKCLGKCTVTYGGQYASTAGFSKTSCDSNVLTRNQIGFWCDYSTGAGAVFSIGGAGSACDRADHGLAVTEENAGKLGTGMGCDFGDNGQSACITQSYALNLWIK